MFSVIIPTYNRIDLLSRAVDSVLRQDFRDFEILIVDDCSKDGTQEKFSQHSDRRIRYFYQKVNSGANAARNLGIHHTKGRWIAFLDSDDEWKENHLSSMRELIHRTKEPERCVFYSSIIYDRGNETLEVKPYAPKAQNISVLDYLLRFDGLMQTSGLVLSAELCKKNLFDERLPTNDDYDFLWRLEKKGVNFILNPISTVTWYADFRKDRISNNASADDCLVWYRILSQSASPSILKVFRAVVISPRYRGIQRLKGIYNVLLSFPYLNFKVFMRTLFIVCLPWSIYKIFVNSLTTSLYFIRKYLSTK